MATSRRIERERQRQLRFAAKAALHQRKLAELEWAQMEAEEYEERISLLGGPHRECGDVIDWASLLHAPPPNPPVRTSTQRQHASAAVAAFQPSMLGKLFGGDEKRLAELKHRVEVASQVDARHYEGCYQNYLTAHANWDASRSLAHAILSGDLEAYSDAIEDLQPFSELCELGCRFNYSFVNATAVQVAMTVNGNSCIPAEIKSVTARGKLSTKKMPATRFNELYQDYVCGSVLRVAREFFALLPLEWVYCTAYTELLNTSTGHQEITPVVSIKIPRSTLLSLNFDIVDASDSMANFVHKMGFKKGAGFSAIEPLAFGP